MLLWICDFQYRVLTDGTGTKSTRIFVYTTFKCFSGKIHGFQISWSTQRDKPIFLVANVTNPFRNCEVHIFYSLSSMLYHVHVLNEESNLWVCTSWPRFWNLVTELSWFFEDIQRLYILNPFLTFKDHTMTINFYSYTHKVIKAVLKKLHKAQFFN